MFEIDKKYDVAIVGGGVIGCSIAWRLAQAGASIAVIERGEPGKEASYAAGGMLAPLAEADEENDFFYFAVAGREMYPDFAREIQASSGIDIEYRTEGTIYLALTGEDEEELEARWRWQHSAGLNIKRLTADCTRKLEPSLTDKLRWALKFPDDHQVNNRNLSEALRVASLQLGVEIFTQTDALNLQIESVAGRKKIAGVLTSRGEIKASAIVIAAGSWSSSLTRSLNELNLEPVRGQMISVEMPAPEFRHAIYTRRGYIVPRLGGILIAGSTSERSGFDKRVTAGGIASIVQHATEITPQFGDLPIVETWGGLRPYSPDGLPVLGPDPNIDGLIYATGHYRNGILLTPITSIVISQLILKGESSVDISPFTPARFIQRIYAG